MTILTGITDDHILTEKVKERERESRVCTWGLPHQLKDSV